MKSNKEFLEIIKRATADSNDKILDLMEPITDDVEIAEALMQYILEIMKSPHIQALKLVLGRSPDFRESLAKLTLVFAFALGAASAEEGRES